jgi:hypothetical protein
MTESASWLINGTLMLRIVPVLFRKNLSLLPVHLESGINIGNAPIGKCADL